MPKVDLVVIFSAAIAGICLGIFWYSRVLFGRWLAGSISFGGTSAGKNKKYKIVFFQTIAELAAAYVLAALIALTGSYSLASLSELILWLWLGLAAAILLETTLREERSWPAYFIHIGFYLADWSLMGLIIINLAGLK